MKITEQQINRESKSQKSHPQIEQTDLYNFTFISFTLPLARRCTETGLALWAAKNVSISRLKKQREDFLINVWPSLSVRTLSTQTKRIHSCIVKAWTHSIWQQRIRTCPYQEWNQIFYIIICIYILYMSDPVHQWEIWPDQDNAFMHSQSRPTCSISKECAHVMTERHCTNFWQFIAESNVRNDKITITYCTLVSC